MSFTMTDAVQVREELQRLLDRRSMVRRHQWVQTLPIGDIPRFDIHPGLHYVSYCRPPKINVYTEVDPHAFAVPFEVACERCVAERTLAEVARELSWEFAYLEETLMNKLLRAASAHLHLWPKYDALPHGDFVLSIRQPPTVLPAGGDRLVAYEEIGMLVGGLPRGSSSSLRFLDVEEEQAGVFDLP